MGWIASNMERNIVNNISQERKAKLKKKNNELYHIGEEIKPSAIRQTIYLLRFGWDMEMQGKVID